MRRLKYFITASCFCLILVATALAVTPTLKGGDYIPPFGLAHDDPAFLSLEKLKDYGISVYWSTHAYKEAHRLELVEALAKALDYLESKELVAASPAKNKFEIVDIPLVSVNYPLAEKVAHNYKLVSLTKNALNPGAELTAGELKTSLSSLLKALKRDAAAQTLTADFPADQQIVKRYELLAAVVKTIEIAEGKKTSSQIVKQEKEEKLTVPTTADFQPTVSFGTLMGHVYEPQSGTNNFSLFGGQLKYENRLNESSLYEVAGSFGSYPVVYLAPHSGSTSATTVMESKIDLQVNAKSPVVKNLYNGTLSFVYGMRGLMLNSSLGSNLVGLRGGVEYQRPVAGKIGWGAWLGATAKLFGAASSSALGSPSSDMDYGLQVDYLVFPGQALSLSYLGNALVFNQSYIRSFNTVLIKNTWLL